MDAVGKRLAAKEAEEDQAVADPGEGGAVSLGEAQVKPANLEEDRKEVEMAPPEPLAQPADGAREPEDVPMAQLVNRPYYSAEDSIAEGLPCYLCWEFSSTSWIALRAHVYNVHGVNSSDLRGTYFHTQCNLEVAARRKAKRIRDRQEKAVQNGEEEDDDEVEDHAPAAVPAALPSAVPKSPAADAIKRAPNGSLWRTMWVRVGNDGQPILPYEVHMVDPAGPLLEPAPHQFAAPPAAAQQQLLPAVASARADLQPEGARPLDAAGLLQEMRGMVQGAVQQMAQAAVRRDIEVAVPKIDLAPLLSEWTHPQESSKRHNCPISDDVPEASCENLKAFHKYLQGLNMKPESIAINMQALKRFLNLVSMEDGAFHPAGLMCAIYKDSAFDKIMALPLMDVRYTWSRKVVVAVDHFCSWLVIACNRERWSEAKTTIEQLIKETLALHKKRCMAYRKTADRLKHRIDADRLQRFPDGDTVKAAVHQAMLDLACISLDAQATGAISHGDKVRANACMVGIIYYNSFAGRSGEWEAMKKQHVLDQIAAGKEFLVCDEHKTSETYGELAKYVPAGSMQAMKVYLNLPGKESDLFLEPASSASNHISVSQFLRRFALTYLPAHEAANCNLIRKQFHTLLNRKAMEGSCMDLLSKVDAHSKAVAQKTYTTKTAEDDSKLGKLLFEGLYGEPVHWPSEEEISMAHASDRQHLALAEGDMEEGEEEDEESDQELTEEQGSVVEQAEEQNDEAKDENKEVKHHDKRDKGKQEKKAELEEEATAAVPSSSSSSRMPAPLGSQVKKSNEKKQKKDKNDEQDKKGKDHQQKRKDEEDEKKDGKAKKDEEKSKKEDKGKKAKKGKAEEAIQYFPATASTMKAFFHGKAAKQDEKKQKQDKIDEQERKEKKDNSDEQETKGKDHQKKRKDEEEEEDEKDVREPQAVRPVKKARAGPFTPAQKEWIEVECNREAKEYHMDVPPNQGIRDILAKGLKDGVLPVGTTIDQVRHVCRTRIRDLD